MLSISSATVHLCDKDLGRRRREAGEKSTFQVSQDRENAEKELTCKRTAAPCLLAR